MYSEKLNEEPVCYQATGDNPGSFILKRNASINSIKLEHVSGWVTCRLPYESYWGCPYYGNERILTIITDNKSKPQFPYKIADANNLHFTLPGVNHESKEIVLPAPDRVPYNGHAGEIMNIWYSEDIRDIYDGNNAGTHCVNVYATYN